MRRPWTDSDLAALREQYPDSPTKSIAEAMGRPLRAVYQKALSLGLRKSAAYLASPAACRLRRGLNVGAETRFKKGQPSWNKGRSYQPGGRCAETQFKKGRPAHESRNYLPIGSQRIVGSNRRAKEMTVWRLLQILQYVRDRVQMAVREDSRDAR